MRLHEIIQTPLSKHVSYDVGRGQLRCDPGAKLMLRQLNRIKALRRVHRREQKRLLKIRGAMYGGDFAMKRAEVAAAEAELDDMQTQLANKLSRLEDERKKHVQRLAEITAGGALAQGHRRLRGEARQARRQSRMKRNLARRQTRHHKGVWPLRFNS